MAHKAKQSKGSLEKGAGRSRSIPHNHNAFSCACYGGTWWR